MLPSQQFAIHVWSILLVDQMSRLWATHSRLHLCAYPLHYTEALFSPCLWGWEWLSQVTIISVWNPAHQYLTSKMVWLGGAVSIAWPDDFASVCVRAHAHIQTCLCMCGRKVAFRPVCAQVENAISVLQGQHCKEKEKPKLLEEDPIVSLIISVKKIPNKTIRPYRMWV